MLHMDIVIYFHLPSSSLILSMTTDRLRKKFNVSDPSPLVRERVNCSTSTSGDVSSMIVIAATVTLVSFGPSM